MTGDSGSGKIIVVGLGPGAWETLTLEAVETMRAAGEVYVRTAVQPSLESIREMLPEVTFHSFDHLYRQLANLDQVYERIVDRLVELAGRPEGVVYAVPGSPAVGETTVRLLKERLGDDGRVQMVQGISFIEPALSAAGVSDASWLAVIDATEAALLASENAVGEAPGEDMLLPWRAPTPTTPLLISQLYDRETASGVKLWLGRCYPDEHPIQLIFMAAGQKVQARTLPLYDLDRQPDIDHRTVVFVPPVSENENVRTFAGLMQLTRRLRGPGGCPWDREQTHATLKPHLLEETYEVLDALDSGDPAALMEELGDLLFQVTIHSQLAAEADEFTIEDVIESIMRKLIGRHPHVFGGDAYPPLQLENAQDVRHHWEMFKQREKPKRTSVLEEIPRGLPALPQSNLMQKRAASVGFVWPGVEEVLDKVEEEIEELRDEIARGRAKDTEREELGDIFFALVSVARYLKVDPEESLRLANRKFAARFRHVESRVTAQGKGIRDLSLEDLEGYWRDAKGEILSPAD